MMIKYLILGAGPAGLTLANYLLLHGESSFLVLEKENSAGGLCRSNEVADYPLDIGGGHFLDYKNEEAKKFLFQYMPEEEWNLYDRDSKISIYGDFIDYPIETNIWQLDMELQIEYLKSIAVAGCIQGNEKPRLFIDWIRWKFGGKIASDYMIPYNKKMFGGNLCNLGTYWLDKLPNVSFEETLRSCLTKKKYGVLPGHSRFYYPIKYGYGEVWLRMAEKICKHIEYGACVDRIDYLNRKVYGAHGECYGAETIITTVPWSSISTHEGMPGQIYRDLLQLKHISVRIDYFPETQPTKAHWIYEPKMGIPYHRILVRHNFCAGKGYWTETNEERSDERSISNSYSNLNGYAYPVNTIDKPVIMQNLLEWTGRHGVIGLGRWGEHAHYNSDVIVTKALNLGKKLLNNNS